MSLEMFQAALKHQSMRTAHDIAHEMLSLFRLFEDRERKVERLVSHLEAPIRCALEVRCLLSCSNHDVEYMWFSEPCQLDKSTMQHDTAEAHELYIASSPGLRQEIDGEQVLSLPIRVFGLGKPVSAIGMR